MYDGRKYNFEGSEFSWKGGLRLFSSNLRVEIGWQKTISVSDVCAFPEPTTQVEETIYAQGAKKNFIMTTVKMPQFLLQVINGLKCKIQPFHHLKKAGNNRKWNKQKLERQS